MLLLMSVYRDVNRLRVVREDPEEAESIIVGLLGTPIDFISSASNLYDRGDYWVELPESVWEDEPSVQYNGILDVANPKIGCITAMTPTGETL